MGKRSRRHRQLERKPRPDSLLYVRSRELDGRLTVSEFDPARLLAAAIVDQARKHRKRTPEEAKKIEEQRQTR